MPPKPVFSFKTFFSRAAERGSRPRLAGAPSAGELKRGVPGRKLFSIASTQQIVSMTPAAPSVWPNIPFAPLTGGQASPKMVSTTRWKRSR